MTERRRARLMGKLEATRTERDQTAEHAKETASRLYRHHEELEKLKGRYLDQKEELRILKATIQQQRENSEVMRYELHALRQQNQQKTAELDQLEAELQRRRSRVRVLESEKQAAAIILRHIMEVKTQHQDQDKRSEIQWKTERLLEILESLAPQVPDSSLRPRKTSSCGNLFAPPRANRTQVQVQVQRLPPLQTDGARPETN
ncbi:uncharacterized protein LOC141790389 [Halichoeres trimaculatus]|uniref:uncharacterized protein LOC141790389 n=1 Tax=Halichoeres trimaculatus TaxID=147232 RepID=UPI003D9EA58B